MKSGKLADWIGEEMGRQGIKLAKLSTRSGVSYQCIRGWLLKENGMRLDEVNAVIRALGYDLRPVKRQTREETATVYGLAMTRRAGNADAGGNAGAGGGVAGEIPGERGQEHGAVYPGAGKPEGRAEKEGQR